MTSADPGRAPLFLFETTTEVFWAEEVAEDEGVPVEVVPAPEGMNDLCGLAIRTLQDHAGAFSRILEKEGISFTEHF
jgi:hypothetical protein